MMDNEREREIDIDILMQFTSTTLSIEIILESGFHRTGCFVVP